MRSEVTKLSVSERRALRKAIKSEVSAQLEHGDRVTIMEIINKEDSLLNPPGKGIGYQAVTFALNPNHNMYSERVIAAARKLIEERKQK